MTAITSQPLLSFQEIHPSLLANIPITKNARMCADINEQLGTDKGHRLSHTSNLENGFFLLKLPLLLEDYNKPFAALSLLFKTLL